MQTSPQALAARILESTDDAQGRFLLTDENVERKVLSLLPEEIQSIPRLTLPPGEASKTPQNLLAIWNWLSENGATRRSALINLGGGMVSDLGGFAAATFKRGIAAVNVPTTLLAAVDASRGGKTGCNLGNLKNEVGLFAEPREVIFSTFPLRTLPRRELLSGLGEMLKAGLIADPALYQQLLDPEPYLADPTQLEDPIKRAVRVKEAIVAADPREQGPREVLNLGHTLGHALESLSLRKGMAARAKDTLAKGGPLAHGEAVAHGLLVAMVLSHLTLGFPSEALYPYASMLREWYPRPGAGCTDQDDLVALMRHDKKNRRPDELRFTLIQRPGRTLPSQSVSERDVRAALEIWQDLIGQ